MGRAAHWRSRFQLRPYSDMSWGYRRSCRIAPGVRLNVSKRGAGLSVGPHVVVAIGRIVALGLVLALPTAAAARADDPAYARANTQLARTVPAFPRGRLVVEEPIAGAIRNVPYEAVQRIYALSGPLNQRRATSFFARKLGRAWHWRGETCLVSGSRLVVVYVHTPRHRLGVVIDSRGARRCAGHVGLVADLLDAGYPDG